MHRTPWTTQGYLVSDRIPSANRPVSTGPKGKEKQKGPPKSQEVRRLEQLRDGLRNYTGKDPRGGCFCQARVHALSEYTPICRHCGLILCSINPPCYACPHCEAPLLTYQAREALISRLEADIGDTLLREEAERQRAAEEARQAAGAFPTLSGAAAPRLPVHSADSLQNHPVNQPHKVLSLNSKTKKVKVSSFTTPPPPATSVLKEAGAENAEQEIPRVPPPPSEVPFAAKPFDPDRPWARLDGENAFYQPIRPGDQKSQTSRDRKGQQRQDSQKAAGASKENKKNTN